MNAISPAISGSSLLSGGSITLDEGTLDALYAASGPLLVIFLVVVLAVLIVLVFLFGKTIMRRRRYGSRRSKRRQSRSYRGRRF